MVQTMAEQAKTLCREARGFASTIGRETRRRASLALLVFIPERVRTLPLLDALIASACKADAIEHSSSEIRNALR